ncbi:MAG: flagellar hook-basal body complex protein FliE [Magnetococcales bacterium]|nr:flagellar hook-basal body complex protein FliE [Magnetococcales bacterium]NGZ07469.1 flagellar hook-basal body complex protein FliE [Magnetococcales bacterium]
MSIQPVGPSVLSAINLSTPAVMGGEGGGGWEDFSVTLARQLKETDRVNKQAKDLSERALLGNAGVSIHEAQIAASEAELNMRLLMQVRNKALEVYREVMSMPA